MYDAQQGATSGAQIDVNTATGTNNWHGQLYGTYANNLMNASPFFFNQDYRLAQNGVGVFPGSLVDPWLRRWSAGITAGGPIKTNKLFFFVAYERTFNEDQATAISELNVPAGLTNDRSDGALLTLDGSSPGGWNCVNSFTHTCATAIDPVASAIMNAKLPNGQYLIPSAQSNAEYNPNLPNAYLIGTSRLRTDQATVALDYDATKTDRVSAKYFIQNAPVMRPFGFSQTAGFPVTAHNGAQVFSLGNTKSIGQRLNWEQRIGFVREGTFSDYKQTFAGGTLGVGDAQTQGLLANILPGLQIKNFAYNDASTASPGLYLGPAGVPGAFVDMGYYQNRVNPSTNLIFTAGKHTIMAGGGYSYTQLNITNNRTGHAQVVVSDFDDFLQGKYILRAS